MEENNMPVIYEGIDLVDNLSNVYEACMKMSSDAVAKLMNPEIIPDGVEFLSQAGEAASDIFKTFKAIRALVSIPNALFLKKFERYCRGAVDLPEEKRREYVERLGKKEFNKEGVFVLNMINRIEEEDKLPLLIKLLGAKMDGVIDDDGYRRLMVLADRTLYRDLLYLKEHITNDPVQLKTDSDHGLASSGLLVFAGNDWRENMDAEDTGARFNYTYAAKKMASIFFGVECDMTPSNKNLVALVMASDEKVNKMIDRIYGPER